MRTALLQSHRQQQLQIKANIKSGNFPWHRWKVTGNQQQPAAKQTGEPTRRTYVQPKRTEPNRTTQHWLCFLRAICGFERISGLCCCLPTRLRPPSLGITRSSPLTPNCCARQMQGTWRMPRLLPQANDRLNIYYSESFALLSSNLNPRVVHLQLYCGYHKETKAKAFIKQNNNEKYQRVPEMKVIQVQVPS